MSYNSRHHELEKALYCCFHSSGFLRCLQTMIQCRTCSTKIYSLFSVSYGETGVLYFRRRVAHIERHMGMDVYLIGHSVLRSVFESMMPGLSSWSFPMRTQSSVSRKVDVSPFPSSRSIHSSVRESDSKLCGHSLAAWESANQ